VVSVDGASVSVAAGDSDVEATAECPAGSIATGGGGVTDTGAATLTDSFATGDPPIGWSVFYRNDTADADTVFATVVCVGIG
jgi:hypothetical protein